MHVVPIEMCDGVFWCNAFNAYSTRGNLWWKVEREGEIREEREKNKDKITSTYGPFGSWNIQDSRAFDVSLRAQRAGETGNQTSSKTPLGRGEEASHRNLDWHAIRTTAGGDKRQFLIRTVDFYQ